MVEAQQLPKPPVFEQGKDPISQIIAMITQILASFKLPGLPEIPCTGESELWKDHTWSGWLTIGQRCRSTLNPTEGNAEGKFVEDKSGLTLDRSGGGPNSKYQLFGTFVPSYNCRIKTTYLYKDVNNGTIHEASMSYSKYVNYLKMTIISLAENDLGKSFSDFTQEEKDNINNYISLVTTEANILDESGLYTDGSWMIYASQEIDSVAYSDNFVENYKVWTAENESDYNNVYVYSPPMVVGETYVSKGTKIEYVSKVV